MPRTRETGLRAVLFTDVVGSTELAREMGDVRWSRLLEAQRRVMRARIRANAGREVDTAGDGFFAVFDRPADAIRCAFDATRDVQELGLDIRAGVHFGEVELAGNEVHGIVVHTGARVMGQAGAAELLITSTVKDLAAGAKVETSERGTFELKGVPGTWALFDVTAIDDRLRPQPIEGASVASERRDRAAAAPPARRSRRWLVGVAAVLVLAVVTAVIVATRPEPIHVPTAGTVARIADEPAFDEPVPLASAPTGMAWGDGRLWVTDQQGQIYWLDVGSGDTGSRGAAGIPTGVAAGLGSIWVTNGFGVGGGPDGGVSQIDPATEELEPAFTTPVGSEAIVTGAERVWVSQPGVGTVAAYDPATHSTEEMLLARDSVGDENAPQPEPIAYGKDAVWVGDAAANRVYRIDPVAGGVETFTVPGPVSAVSVGGGAVWLAHGEADAVTVLDADTGDVITSIDVADRGCDRPDTIAAEDNDVWVGCSVSGTVLRIDPRSRTAGESLSVDGAPAALAIDADGAVWVAVRPA